MDPVIRLAGFFAENSDLILVSGGLIDQFFDKTMSHHTISNHAESYSTHCGLTGMTEVSLYDKGTSDVLM